MEFQKKKELMGIYLFERVEEYFEENENGKITLGSRRIDLERFWYGESRAALKLQACILTEECKSISEKLDKELKCAMSDLVYLGQIAGIEWGDELFYRRKPDKQNDTGKVLFLAFSGIGGFAIGWLLFDAWWLGIVYAMLLGSFMSFGVQNGNSKDWGMYHLNQILDAESEEKKMPLINHLKEHRARLNVNQQEMGKLVQTSRQTIGQIERGDYSPICDTGFEACKSLWLQG